MTGPSKINEFYSHSIKPLPAADRRRLLALMARDLAHADDSEASGERSLLELEGLGAEIWLDIEAQAYVDAVRDEWERHP
jgi:hypothetical protein